MNEKEDITNDIEMSVDAQIDAFVLDAEKLSTHNDSALDARTFSREIARLLKKHENLLNIHSVIINRAYSFVKDRFDLDTAESVIDSLTNDFGVLRDDDDDPLMSRPIAVGSVTKKE